VRPPEPVSARPEARNYPLPSASLLLTAEVAMPKETKANNKDNDLEGAQDMGGKHGGQAGVPKPEPQPNPRSSVKSEDVPEQRSTGKTGRG
jgi:hypothetical protein